jgi:hypothetical protein
VCNDDVIVLRAEGRRELYSYDVPGYGPYRVSKEEFERGSDLGPDQLHVGGSIARDRVSGSSRVLIPRGTGIKRRF